MNLYSAFVTFILTICSTAIMSYISMTMPIGPWIETTLALSAMLLFQLYKNATKEKSKLHVGLTTAAGGISGIIATAFGFSFPTLYFLAPEIFKLFLSNPIYFSIVLGLLSFCAGSLGLISAFIFREKLIVEQNFSFPIGELLYKIIWMQNHINQSLQLTIGFFVTFAFLIINFLTNIFPKNLLLISKFETQLITIPLIAIPLNITPMFVSIGFITGHVIAIPLLLGICIKLFLIDIICKIYPILYDYLSTLFNFERYSEISQSDFIFAFSSGIILYSAIASFLSFINYKKLKYFFYTTSLFSKNQFNGVKNMPWIKILLLCFLIFLFFAYFNFSILSQIYVILGTLISIYQLIFIAGKIGIAPLGRFATFVMVPGMFLFGFNPLQITVVSTFVEIAGGVACDALFSYKMAFLANIDTNKIWFYQWFGLLVCSIFVGIIFWILFQAFELGICATGSFPATKAMARALMVNIKSFDLLILSIGFVCGYSISLLKVSPILVLSGILMPPNLSIMLILGGLLTYLMKEKEKYYPIWSGIFAANSLWMVVKGFIICLN